MVALVTLIGTDQNCCLITKWKSSLRDCFLMLVCAPWLDLGWLRFHIFIIIYDEGYSWGGNMPELHALTIITLLAALLGLAQWLCIPGRSSRLLSASSTSSAQLKLLPEFLVVCSNWSQSLRRQPTIWQRCHFILITIIIIIVTVTIVKSSDDEIHLPKNPSHCILQRRAAPFVFFSCCNDYLGWKRL